MSPAYRSMTFEEYWQTYFPDLIAPLSTKSRGCVLSKLRSAFVEEQYPGRDVVQRLVEVHEGTISVEQYFAWMMSTAEDGGAEHLVTHLAAGEYVNGNRADTVRILANIEYSPVFADRVYGAAEEGVLTSDELVQVLSTSLRNAPLPRLRQAPHDVAVLPFRGVAMTSSHACEQRDVEHAEVG